VRRQGQPAVRQATWKLKLVGAAMALGACWILLVVALGAIGPTSLERHQLPAGLHPPRLARGPRIRVLPAVEVLPVVNMEAMLPPCRDHRTPTSTSRQYSRSWRPWTGRSRRPRGAVMHGAGSSARVVVGVTASFRCGRPPGTQRTTLDRSDVEHFSAPTAEGVPDARVRLHPDPRRAALAHHRA